MKTRLCTAAFLCLCLPAAAQTLVFEQPHAGSGVIYRSCWWDPNGSNWDQYIWDAFTIPQTTAITEVRWRGGFDPTYGGSGGPVLDFTVEIWSSIQGGSQPDIGSVFAPNPLRHYVSTGNCNQTPAGSFGGVVMYDYRFTLPQAFQAAANTKYWLRLHAWQHGVPDWGFAAGAGGDGSYFRKLAEYMYQSAPGDMAFALYTTGGANYAIAASVSPANAGTLAGAGTYPSGSTASLAASANPGYGFVNWTENGNQVSTSATYNFTVNSDRTLIANFTTAYTIATSVSPPLGGFATGDGVYNSGSAVTATATPAAGYSFIEWTEFGSPVSTSASYTFSASANRTLTANFAAAGTSILFDFDTAPIHTSLPIDVTVDGLVAHLSATGSGFSIQQANTMGFTPAGFSGLCIYPSSVFAADLRVSFSQLITDFSIMYSPQELGCDDSATMRVTAWKSNNMVGTNTTTAPQPGTWPTGTLSISVPAGFDSVVVHYDAHPPTCQDYGVIFMADNMLVTPACAGPSMIQQPVSDEICTFGGSNFFATADGTFPIQHIWQAELDPGVWSDLSDGDLYHNGILIASMFGAASDWMQVYNVGQFLSDRNSLNLRCAATNACGSTISNVATLTVWPTATGDANLDGTIDGRDIQIFINLMMGGYTSMSAWCASDLDQDGFFDESEVPLMVNLLLAQ